MAPATVLKKRGAKSEEEGEVFGGGGGITEHPKTVCEAAEAGSMGEPCAAGVTKRPGSIEEDALAVSKRPRANGEEEEDVFGCGGGITERPKTEGEMAAAEAGSKGEPCAAGVTKRPGSIEEESLAVGKRPGAEFEEEAADYDSEKEHVRQNFVYKKMLTRPHAAPGKDGKRRTVVRLDKESVEIRMSQPPPTPYPRMSECPTSTSTGSSGGGPGSVPRKTSARPLVRSSSTGTPRCAGSTRSTGTPSSSSPTTTRMMTSTR
ncbi:unnamed protein product [Urochloa humidicola]